MDKSNARANNPKRTKLARAIGNKRKRRASDIKSNSPAPAINKPEFNESNISANDNFISALRGTEGDNEQSGGIGDGSAGIGGNRGNGRNGGATGGDNDNQSSSTGERISPRTGRPVRKYRKRSNSISEDIFLNSKKQKPPKFLGDFEDEISSGFEASVLILSELIQTGSELAAIVTAKEYIKFQKSESKELSQAWLETLDALPSKWRKQFDKIFSRYYPFWKLATVAAKIAYPRYIMFQLEKQMMESTKNVKPFAAKQSSAKSESIFNQDEDSELNSKQYGNTA